MDCPGFAVDEEAVYVTGNMFAHTGGATNWCQRLWIIVGVDYYVRTFGIPGVDRNRWGDYSGISLDPVDETQFWVFGEFADVRESTWEMGMVGGARHGRG